MAPLPTPEAGSDPCLLALPALPGALLLPKGAPLEEGNSGHVLPVRKLWVHQLGWEWVLGPEGKGRKGDETP